MGRRGGRGRRLSGSSRTEDEPRLQPVEAFVVMENDAATELCRVVTTSLEAVKKVGGVEVWGSTGRQTG